MVCGGRGLSTNVPLTGLFMLQGYSTELAEEVAKELEQTLQTYTFSINMQTHLETVEPRPQCNVRQLAW